MVCLNDMNIILFLLQCHEDAFRICPMSRKRALADLRFLCSLPHTRGIFHVTRCKSSRRQYVVLVVGSDEVQRLHRLRTLARFPEQAHDESRV